MSHKHRSPNKLKIEAILGDWLKRHFSGHLYEFIAFVSKMAWSCIFAGLLLSAIIVTKFVFPENDYLTRYDFLTVFAIICQILMIAFKLESFEEVKVIFLFHISGTIMEIYKLHQGSWDYPDTGFLEILGVPMFSGFMYASVGSFMARCSRIFEMRYEPFPNYWFGLSLAIVIYMNFFTHHYIYDLRWILIALTFILFGKTWIYFKPSSKTYKMPLVLAAFLSSLFLYLAENIGTLTATWTYAGTEGFAFTNYSKISSWYLLLYLSFMQVYLLTLKKEKH